MWKTFWRTATLLMTVACSVPRASDRGSSSAAYVPFTGEWWLAQSAPRRYGFVAGNVDCFFGDVGGESIAGDSSFQSLTQLTSAYFAAHPDRRQEAVGDAVLGKSFRTDARRIRPDWHANWDGNYWVNMYFSGDSLHGEEQLGFLEGYLDCYRRFKPDGNDVFPKPAVVYQGEITNWYGFDSTSGDRLAERESVPIAAVLRDLGTRRE